MLQSAPFRKGLSRVVGSDGRYSLAKVCRLILSQFLWKTAFGAYLILVTRGNGENDVYERHANRRF